MTTEGALTTDQRGARFGDNPPLRFRDIKAEVCAGAGLLQIYSENQNGPDGEVITLDPAEAVALRNWLNEVLK